MKVISRHWLGYSVFVIGALSAQADLSSFEAEQLFVRRVQPMLQEKCISCHGGDEAKIKGGLDLRTKEETLSGGDVAPRP